MDYLGTVGKSIEYIEENITEKLTLEEIAEKVFLSPFHFHRIFTVFTGYSLKEYIRKRRLYLAIKELKNPKKTIMETAVEYGYSTNESFSRAVQKEFGYKPSEMRKNCIDNIEFEKLRLWGIRYRKEHGEKEILCEFMHTEEMLIAGVVRSLTLNDGENYIEIPKIKKVLLEYKDSIENIKNPTVNRQIGIALTGPMDLQNPFNNKFIYFRGFEIDIIGKTPKEMEIKKIDSVYCGKFYAGKTIKEHADALDYVYGIWLPENGFEIANVGFDFMEEIIEYDDENKEFFFYIPIKEQEKSSGE